MGWPWVCVVSALNYWSWKRRNLVLVLRFLNYPKTSQESIGIHIWKLCCQLLLINGLKSLCYSCLPIRFPIKQWYICVCFKVLRFSVQSVHSMVCWCYQWEVNLNPPLYSSHSTHKAGSDLCQLTFSGWSRKQIILFTLRISKLTLLYTSKISWPKYTVLIIEKWTLILNSKIEYLTLNI